MINILLINKNTKQDVDAIIFRPNENTVIYTDGKKDVMTDNDYEQNIVAKPSE